MNDESGGVYTIVFDETLQIDADEEYKVLGDISHATGHLRTERKMVCLIHRG